MYYYIKGKVADIFENLIVLDNNGVGYEVYVTTQLISNIKINENHKFYIFHYTNPREYDQKLFGFLEEEEKKMFLALISVNGIGPVSAINILSSISYRKLYDAIVYQDAKTISNAKGVGKKVAERIILELKGKISFEEEDSFTKTQNILGIDATKDEQSQQIIDAQEVLLSFGYSLVEVKQAIKKAATLEKTTENIVKVALKLISGGK